MLSLVLILLALILSGVSGLVVCQAESGQPTIQNMNDASISEAVHFKLAADSMVGFTRVDVETERGTVFLNGVVQTSELKARAEEVARKVGGVKRVTNNLQVQTAKQR